MYIASEYEPFYDTIWYDYDYSKKETLKQNIKNHHRSNTYPDKYLYFTEFEIDIFEIITVEVVQGLVRERTGPVSNISF